VLGQEATDVKSNEITATAKLLALLELKGCPGAKIQGAKNNAMR